MAKYVLCIEDEITAKHHLLLDLKVLMGVALVIGSGVKFSGLDCF